MWAPSPNSQPFCFKLCRAEQCSAELSRALSSEGQKSAAFPGVWRRIKSAAVRLTLCVPFSGRARRSVFSTGLKVRAHCFNVDFLTHTNTCTQTARSHGNSRCFLAEIQECRRPLTLLLQPDEVWKFSALPTHHLNLDL